MSLIVSVRYCSYSPHMSHPSRFRRQGPWVARTLLVLGVAAATVPAVPAYASAETSISGHVTFSEDHTDRTLEVYRETSPGRWTEDASRQTEVAADGSYTVLPPVGVPVRLRVGFATPEYGYWLGDVFDADLAESVTAGAGEQVDGVDLVVPVPVTYSGRLVDRRGNPVAGSVTPTVNTDGASLPLVAPVSVEADGSYEVVLPARHDGVYEAGVLGTDASGDTWAWLGGGSGWEPDWYLNPMPGEVHTDEDITLPLGPAQSVVPPSKSTPASTTRFRATGSPVVRGTVRRGVRLRATAGRYSTRPTVVRYQWLRNGHTIRGAHRSTYRLRKADVRSRVSVRVTAYRSGTKVQVISPRTAPVRRR